MEGIADLVRAPSDPAPVLLGELPEGPLHLGEGRLSAQDGDLRPLELLPGSSRGEQREAPGQLGVERADGLVRVPGRGHGGWLV